ncbi:MAG: response regulator [Planctomycetes bacterium]|nr:response regulator [Planctomycetota bacterium]
MKKYFSTSEVAQLCNVHRNTIIAAIKKRILKAHKTPGGHSRIAYTDLVKFCQERGIPFSEPIVNGVKVLIVDDDPILPTILAKGLESEGYAVAIAQNGYDAGFLTIEYKPIIILLDVLLPDINGDIVCKRIRSHSETKDIYIIAMSGVSNTRVETQMIDAGADYFLPKPFNLDDVLRIVNKLRDIHLRKKDTTNNQNE